MSGVRKGQRLVSVKAKCGHNIDVMIPDSREVTIFAKLYNRNYNSLYHNLSLIQASLVNKKYLNEIEDFQFYREDDSYPKDKLVTKYDKIEKKYSNQDLTLFKYLY